MVFIEQRASTQPVDHTLSESRQFAELVLELGRNVRQILAEHLDCWGAIKLSEIKVWSAVRNELAYSNDPMALLQKCARSVAITYLESADRLAIEERDVLRRLMVQAGLEALRSHTTPVSHVAHIQERLEHLPVDQRALLDLYYARSVALEHLSVQRNLSHADLAHQICLARAACDWHNSPTAADDRLMHSMIEDLFTDTLDPDSRALLVTSVTKDLGRGDRFERQIRIHLLLKTMFAPFGQNEVQSIVYPHLNQAEQRRLSTSATGSSTSAKKRNSGSKHSSISSRLPTSHQKTRSHSGLLIAVMLGGILMLTAIWKAIEDPVKSENSKLFSQSAPSTSANQSVVAPPSPTAIAPSSESLPIPQQNLKQPSATSFASTPSNTTEKLSSDSEPQAIAGPTSKSPLPANPIPPTADAETAPERIIVTLINADTDKPIPGYEDLPNEITIRLSQLPTKKLNFTFDSKSPMKSLGYQFPGCSLSKKGRFYANARPFSLGRDGQDFHAWTPAPGDYTLTITVYHDRHGNNPSFTSRRQIRFED